MKRLISAVLVITLALSVVFSTAVSTSAQTTMDLTLLASQGTNRIKDFAPLSANDDEIFYYSSHYPYEEITYDGCTVYGYIGDADGDGEITVVDASLIQLHLVDKKQLSENGCLLSDTDGDDSITIVDAAAIQLFLVGKSNNEYITRTVFAFVEETERTVAFDQISELTMLFGMYNEEENFYYLDFYGYYGEDVLGVVVVYLPEYRAIQIESALYSPETETMVDSYIDIFRGMSLFVFDSFMSDAELETFYFETIGESELLSEDPYVFRTDCVSFESKYYDNFNDIKDLCELSFCAAIDGLQAIANEYTESIDVRNLFRKD